MLDRPPIWCAIVRSTQAAGWSFGGVDDTAESAAGVGVGLAGSELRRGLRVATSNSVTLIPTRIMNGPNITFLLQGLRLSSALAARIAAHGRIQTAEAATR